VQIHGELRLVGAREAIRVRVRSCSTAKEPAMSALFRTDRTRITEAPAPASESPAGSALPSLYLTDGVFLYRFIGTTPHGMGEMVELEDCYTLYTTLVPLGDLRARRLRVVIPAEQ
jgi:hypothetical protein